MTAKGEPRFRIGTDEWMAKWVSVDAHRCWNWLGRGSGGRGPHLRVYKTLVGTPAPGQQLDHLCLNIRCVNPAHLERVTLQENMRRSFESGDRLSDCCPNGHDYALTGYRVRADGARSCIACRAAKDKRQVARNQARERRTSQYVGVSWHRATEKWQAGLKHQGKGRHLGLFASEEAAAEAYARASRAIWPERKP